MKNITTKNIRQYFSYGVLNLESEMLWPVNSFSDIPREATLEVCARHQVFVSFLLLCSKSVFRNPSEYGEHMPKDRAGCKIMHAHYCHATYIAIMKLQLSFHDFQAACPHHRSHHRHADAGHFSAVASPEQTERKSSEQRFASPWRRPPGSMSNRMSGLHKNKSLSLRHTGTENTRPPRGHRSNIVHAALETKPCGKDIGLDSPQQISVSPGDLAANTERPCLPPMSASISSEAGEHIKKSLRQPNLRKRNRPDSRAVGRGWCPGPDEPAARTTKSTEIRTTKSTEMPKTKQRSA